MKIIKLTLKNKNYLIKKLSFGRLKTVTGRNNLGRITVRHRGGGVKNVGRFIDHKHLLWNLRGVILTIEYSSRRTGFLNLICYSNGILAYKIATENLPVGSFINVGLKSYNVSYINIPGSVSYLKNLKDGMFIHNVEMINLKGAQLARAAGTTIQIIKLNYNKNLALLKLSSGEERLVDKNNICTIGQVSNSKHFLKKFYKAGQLRNLSCRPEVRGVAMNPIDHPHGGGQGKTSGAGGFRNQVTFKGLPAKGKPTRSRNKKNSFILNRLKK